MIQIYEESETEKLAARVKKKIIFTSVCAGLMFGTIVVLYFIMTTGQFYVMRKITFRLMMFGGLFLLFLVHAVVLPDYWDLKHRRLMKREPKVVSTGRYKITEEKIPIRKEITVDVLELETRNKVENLMIDHRKADLLKQSGRLIRVESARSYITSFEELKSWNTFEN